MSAVAHADDPADLRPSWIDNYAVWSGRADLRTPNHSYLGNRQVGMAFEDNPVADQLGSLIDSRRALEWRQQYDDLNRDYEMKKRAGLAGPALEQAQSGAMSQFRDGVVDETRQRKLQETGNIAVRAVGKDETARSILAPGAVLAGVWIGRRVNLRVARDFRFTFRTSLRDKLGQIELHSPFVYGSFEYHPEAPQAYSLLSSAAVDFGRMMNFRHIVDFGAERYQLMLARDLPFFDILGAVQYGSSSNVLASSLTKQLTSNLAAVVDSIYYLTPYDSDHTSEERVRLRYDIHF